MTRTIYSKNLNKWTTVLYFFLVLNKFIKNNTAFICFTGVMKYWKKGNSVHIVFISYGHRSP